MMKVKQPYIVFFGPDGKELLRYTVHGTFPGERENTIQLLAYEKGLLPGEISFAVITA